jgi:hypothetical protein
MGKTCKMDSFWQKKDVFFTVEWLPGMSVKWLVQTSNHKMQNASPL